MELEELSVVEKAAVLSGGSEWDSRGNDRADIPSFVMSDGPHGVRRQLGEGDHLGIGASKPATCFPTAGTVANSWDPALAEEMGEALGNEAHDLDVNVLLGPGLNIKRNPLCGRNFEMCIRDRLYPILNKRIPRRYLYISGMISMIVAYVLLGLFSTNIVVVFIALVLFYVPGTLIQMTAILSLTDSIEYGQLKNGKRNEAVTLSVRPMLDKIGGALSNGITGFIAVAAGMTGSATAADMTPANIHTFEVCAFYVPLVLIVLSLLVFTFKVKISEKMHAEIVEQLEAKLTAGEVSDEEAKTVETVEAVNEKAKTLTE